MNNLDTKIQTLKAKGLQIPEELSDRRQAVEFKLNLLRVQAETGQLDQEQYFASLRNKISQEKTWAGKLMKEGKKDFATLALKRAKLMETELESSVE